MSNITLFKQGNLAVPDFLQQSDDLTKMLAGGGGSKAISIKGGVWRMIVGGEEVAKNEDRALNIIVVAANPKVNRTFYGSTYEEGKDSPPSCWSADGIRPNEEVPADTRQCATCADCPQNIAGSGEGTSRACRFSRRLAVVLENDIDGNIYRLQLPARSIFGKADGDKMPLDAYAKFLAGHNVPITGVVTEARFDTAEAVPVIKFRAVRPLSREEWESARAAATHTDAAMAVEFKMVVKSQPTTGAVVATKARKQVPATNSYSEEDTAPAPQVRSSKPKDVPPAPAAEVPTKVQAVVSQWLDDDDE